MISGIYRLTFSDGSFYIGKSNDIESRWKQHSKNLLEGKHTKKMQEAYNKCGDPTFEIMVQCHPHHTDILEAYHIATWWGPGILNTTKPNISLEDISIISKIRDKYWEYGTFEHIELIDYLMRSEENLKDRIEELESEIVADWQIYEENLSDIKSGTLLSITEKQLEYANIDVKKLTNELDKLKNRGLFARIFNLGA